MKSVFQSEYRKFFFWALVLNIITAWFSLGYHHPDEHFQILEICNYKLGNTPIADLPWEFAAKARPGLQPFIAYCFIRVFHFLGILNPFLITFLLRLSIALTGWFVVCKLVMLLLPDFSTPKGKKIFILLSFFLWFVPYLNARFSSENAAAVCFLWIFYLLLKPYTSSNIKNSSFLLIGFLLGLSFFFRFQMAFAIVGVGAWLLFIKKINWKNWLALIFAGLIAAGLCICIDRWQYGAWVFTPYHYYHVNILENVAASSGVDPGWWYFMLFFWIAIPPLSLVLLGGFFIGTYIKPKHVFVFALLGFLIGHAIIGHKEMRFLFPMWFAFIYLASVGFDWCIVKYKSNKWFTYSFGFLMVLNCLMLTYRTFVPAQEAIPCFKFVYSYFKQKNTTILCVREPVFCLAGVKADFYKPKNINEIVFKDEDALASYMDTNKEDSVIVFKKTATLGNKLSSTYRNKRIYLLYPEWLLNFNFNNWIERANVWSMYVLYKK